jgi:hypothetical protein
MKKQVLKRVLPVAMAALLLFAVGCAKSPVKEGENTTAQEPVSMEAATEAEAEIDAAGVDHSSLYTVDGVSEESASASFASDTANVNAVLVQNAGVLTMTSADINKSGDSSGDLSGGQNAAVAVLSKGQMTLNESNITTNALGGFGAIVAGEGSLLSMSGTSVYTSGDSSPVIVVREGASAAILGGTLSSEGADAPCLLLAGGTVSLSGVTLSAQGGEVLRVLAGASDLTLDQTGIVASPIIDEGATLTLRLQNGASFTGELGGMLPAKASVYLDAASKLVLGAETYVTALVNADTTHANIESNGFNLYYDSNAPENAYLEGQSFMLPGGGFLAPII